MAHDRHPAPGQKAHGLGHLRTTFELDRGASGIGHDARGVAERLLRGFLIGAERQVDDDHCPRRAAHDGRAMRDHHLDRDRKRAVETVDHHAQRIADQQEVYVRVEQPGDGCGIGGQPDDRCGAFDKVADRAPAHPAGSM